jgi:POT family proton-dependent oligopeptide transporter
MSDQQNSPPPRNPVQEIIQPFIDLLRAPRALWGVNLGYVIEGMVYFGILGYLAMYFNEYIGLNDIWAGRMVGVLTAGITIAMFFLGTVADQKGVRFALLAAFVLMIVGRVLISAAPLTSPEYVRIAADEAGRNDPVFIVADAEPIPAEDAPAANTQPAEDAEAPSAAAADTQPTTAPAAAGDAVEEPSPGFGSMAHWLALLGILIVVIGYGMYQPGAYAAVRQFTTEKTAAMGFAMLYALMNLGGWIPTYAFLLRNNQSELFGAKIPGAGFGILGMIWLYTACTAVALFATAMILSRKTVAAATAAAKEERAREKAAKAAASEKPAEPATAEPPRRSTGNAVLDYFVNHPLADAKFAFFIFCLIPVQTLFAHNWLTLPMYVERAFTETAPDISENFEIAVNLNPLLIFIFVPIVTALTQRAKVYNMMIIGTLIMAAPTFLLAIGPYVWTLFGFLVLMTIGEAMWQPRFLQYAAEIAPEGRTGVYMGVAQLPWFLTKMIVPLYSGWFLQQYVPKEGPTNSEWMWLVYGCIAMSSTVLLLLAKGWIGKDFKTKAD